MEIYCGNCYAISLFINSLILVFLIRVLHDKVKQLERCVGFVHNVSNINIDISRRIVKFLQDAETLEDDEGDEDYDVGQLAVDDLRPDIREANLHFMQELYPN